MSCSAPNIQNIPKTTAYRRCICPPAGRVFVKADYSQIELRIAAQVSGDPAMKNAFKTGEDLHTKTARAILGREPDDSDRSRAKAINFGFLYGMGATTFKKHAKTNYGVDVTDREAAQYRATFFTTYPGIRRWHNAQTNEEITTRTLAGRPRHKVSRFTEKLASPISGTGADILKLALARLWNDRAAVPTGALIAVIHDEILLEVDENEAGHAAAWLRDHMIAAGEELLSDVPVEVEAHIVPDWSGKANDIENDVDVETNDIALESD